MKILVTGCAGFIGFHLSKKLLENNYQTYGIDNLNNYYDVKLKKDRLKILRKNKKFFFYKINIFNKNNILNNFKKNKYDIVINLAAQAGVRHSIKNPKDYLDSNIIGFFNILEASRLIKTKHLLFASSSSVYGPNKQFPLKENYNTDFPLSFYAASKKTNEIIASSYNQIYKMNITGLRFFTVYGPYGRPDMALFRFTKNIINSKKIEVYNNGNHSRDFTYIDDVVNYVYSLAIKKYKDKKNFNIFNIGSSKPYKLLKFIEIIEKKLNKKARKVFKPKQTGDVEKTFSDSSNIKKIIKLDKITPIERGIENFINWYKDYYSIK